MVVQIVVCTSGEEYWVIARAHVNLETREGVVELKVICLAHSCLCEC